MNREQWLTDLASKAIPAISAILEYSDEEPSVKLSCGFPAKQGKRTPISAQLVPPTASDDFNAEIFVSPTISNSDEVIEAVVPLLVAVVTGDFKQGANWRNALNRLNNASMTIERLQAEMPEYPHSAITLPTTIKQTTRLIKVSCAQDGYIARVSRATIENLGSPICPACQLSMEINA
jgi:hypothetical protein